MKKWYKKVLLAGMIFLLLAGCGKQKNSYVSKIVESIDSAEGAVQLSELTPFAWDAAYVFKPYTTKDSIKEVLNCKVNAYRTSSSDTDTLIYFLKEGNIVCCLSGNMEEMHFYVDYNFEEFYCQLNNTSTIEIDTKNNTKCIKMQ